MLTFEQFTGIDNVQPQHRLSRSALVTAVNVDIGLSGELKRRGGYAEAAASCHKNLWQGRDFMLATVAGNDLSAFVPGGAYTVVSPALGPDRVWYCNLPDGRTAFSNGLINGLTDGGAATSWGVEIPASAGVTSDVAGALTPGDYRYQITYTRIAGGIEGGPAYSAPFTIAQGGVVLSDLPQLDGHRINVYLTAADGDHAFYVGYTLTTTFAFTGANDTLTIPCRTDFLYPAPKGTVMAFWRGRVLIADGPTLFASLPSRWEHFDLRRDFKQFSGDITLIQPSDGGVYVGTTKELAFLKGDEFDKLTYECVVEAPTVLGSGVAVPGELIKRGEGTGQGEAMICIADRCLIAGFGGGEIERLTEGVYETAVTEVAATFRMVDRIPQYVAIPQ